MRFKGVCPLPPSRTPLSKQKSSSCVPLKKTGMSKMCFVTMLSSVQCWKYRYRLLDWKCFAKFMPTQSWVLIKPCWKPTPGHMHVYFNIQPKRWKVDYCRLNQSNTRTERGILNLNLSKNHSGFLIFNLHFIFTQQSNSLLSFDTFLNGLSCWPHKLWETDLLRQIQAI